MTPAGQSIVIADAILIAAASWRAAVRAASAEFDRFAAKTRGAGRTSLAELQQHSTELRELSAELRPRAKCRVTLRSRC